MIKRDPKGRFMKGSACKHTNESKRKLSEARMGMRFSKEHKKRISISKSNPSKEARKNISRAAKIRMTKFKHPMLGKKHNLKTKLKMRKAKLGKFGELSNNWQGGIGLLNHRLRASAKYQIWRNAVLIRDNFTCQNPNCEFCNNKIGVMLHPHHIKLLKSFPELAYNINNGITYCAEFHIKSGLHKVNLNANII